MMTDLKDRAREWASVLKIGDTVLIKSERILSVHNFPQSGCDPIYGNYKGGDIGIRIRIPVCILSLHEYVHLFFREWIPAKFHGERYEIRCSRYDVFDPENGPSPKNQMHKSKSRCVEMYALLRKVDV